MRNIDGPGLFGLAIIFGGLAVIAGFTLLWLVSLARRTRQSATATATAKSPHSTPPMVKVTVVLMVLAMAWKIADHPKAPGRPSSMISEPVISLPARPLA